MTQINILFFLQLLLLSFCITGFWSSRWANCWWQFMPWTMPSLSQISTASRSTPVNVSTTCLIDSCSYDCSSAVPLVKGFVHCCPWCGASVTGTRFPNSQRHLIVFMRRRCGLADLHQDTTKVFCIIPLRFHETLQCITDTQALCLIVLQVGWGCSSVGSVRLAHC